jgi:transcriptional regulator with XRE-family HTH domain
MDKVRKLAEKGWTDKEMADFFGVTKQTWDNWKKANPDFFASLVDWKAGADERVERSLYERAVGYEHEDTYFANFQGSIITQTYTKHYPPDTRACQYWLNNRQRDKWRNYAPVENTDDELKPKITEREFVD